MREPAIEGFPHMLVGNMRVSSDGDRQTTAPQRDALLATGVDDRPPGCLIVLATRKSQTIFRFVTVRMA